MDIDIDVHTHTYIHISFLLQSKKFLDLVENVIEIFESDTQLVFLYLVKGHPQKQLECLFYNCSVSLTVPACH